jgi:hypothetical protein
MCPGHLRNVPRLIAAIDRHGVVRRRLSEVHFPRRVAVVTEEAGVDQHRPSSERDNRRQTIGVSVRGARHVVAPQAGGLFAAVETDVVGIVRPAAARHVIAARQKCA